MRDFPYFINEEKCVSLQPKNLFAEETQMSKTTQVAILEDHPVFLTGIKMSLAPVYHVCLEASTVGEFFDKLPSVSPDILILDLILPDASGIDVAKRLRSEHPDIKILVLSIDTREETLQQLLEIGVEGFLCKNASEDSVLDAVRAITGGKKYFSRPEDVLERDILIAARNDRHKTLTDREYDIMLAFCKGMSGQEIAQQMFISPKTVDNHKQHIFAKLGIHNIVQLVIYAVRNKIIVLN